MEQRRLEGRTALVTGAGRRLGRAVALELADAGVNLILHCNSSVKEATALRDEALGKGVRAELLRADFSVAGEAQRLIGSAFELDSSLNILVNSASIFPRSGVGDVTFDDLTGNMAVNAWAPFVLSRTFAATVKEGGIVNLLDTRITGFDPVHVAYHLSKQMLALLTRLSAIEFAPAVTVNGVAPGLVLAPVEMDREGMDNTGFMDKMARELPLKRHGAPEDVAEAVLFLLSSRFITGQIIYVDGGRHIRERSNG